MLFALTHAILFREFRLRSLPLTTQQQFRMFGILVADVRDNDLIWSSEVLATAAELAGDAPIDQATVSGLESHPLLVQVSMSEFRPRYEALVRFTPAVWLANFLSNPAPDAEAEKYLEWVVSSSASVLGDVVGLLCREEKWASGLRHHIAGRLASGSTACLWTLTQQLLHAVGVANPTDRTRELLSIFGQTDGNDCEFNGLRFLAFSHNWI